ncbi:NUDIX domain-containing protein [Corynebacterium sp. p3-SID1056]|uniref:NUDIX domain-containing protein n=1 Tax=Corynebacterium sp. p3-SID1056 TaxID=2916092 RepID=UPI0021A5B780|nr:NUDIX hydrolase [Corynebacterium sp. p3-SID1056]MCT2339821.1 NUDIX hydrolase [Corynebacterium sp. p3-SID1056]
MLGDGNGWVTGPNGEKYWGKYGAAGLFLQAGEKILLQHRAAWTAQGDTWGIPGGARDSHETATEAALRETVEECAIDPARVQPFKEVVTFEAPGWNYTTVLARTVDGDPLPVKANEESEELRWVPLDAVCELQLHPGFAAALEELIGHTRPHD